DQAETVGCVAVVQVIDAGDIGEKIEAALLVEELQGVEDLVSGDDGARLAAEFADLDRRDRPLERFDCGRIRLRHRNESVRLPYEFNDSISLFQMTGLRALSICGRPVSSTRARLGCCRD